MVEVAAEDLFRFSWARGSLYYVSTVLIGVGLCFSWMVTHARENDVEVSKSLKVAAILVSGLALPYYKFGYYGVKAGFVFLAWVAAWLALSVAALELLDLAF